MDAVNDVPTAAQLLEHAALTAGRDDQVVFGADRWCVIARHIDGLHALIAGLEADLARVRGTLQFNRAEHDKQITALRQTLADANGLIYQLRCELAARDSAS